MEILTKKHTHTFIGLNNDTLFLLNDIVREGLNASAFENSKNKLVRGLNLVFILAFK